MHTRRCYERELSFAVIMAAGREVKSSALTRTFLLLLIIYIAEIQLEHWNCPSEGKGIAIEDKNLVGGVLSPNRYFASARRKPRCRGRSFALGRMPFSTDLRSTFILQRLTVCGDIQSNPGPSKYPCKECAKAVRNNQNAILCCECKYWIHAKCLGMSIPAFNLDRPDLEWACPTCSLPRLNDSFFNDETYLIDQADDMPKERHYANYQKAGTSDNRPFHGFRPPFCWVGMEIKERLPSPIQILLKSAHGAESTVRFGIFLQFYVSKRHRSLEPIEVSVFSSRLVNISSIRWKSEQLWTKPAHLDSRARASSHVCNQNKQSQGF